MPKEKIPDHLKYKFKRDKMVTMKMTAEEIDILNDLITQSGKLRADYLRDSILQRNGEVSMVDNSIVEDLKTKNETLEKRNNKLIQRLNGLFDLMNNKLPPISELPDNMEDIQYNNDDFYFIDKIKKTLTKYTEA